MDLWGYKKKPIVHLQNHVLIVLNGMILVYSMKNPFFIKHVQESKNVQKRMKNTSFLMIRGFSMLIFILVPNVTLYELFGWIKRCRIVCLV